MATNLQVAIVALLILGAVSFPMREDNQPPRRTNYVTCGYHLQLIWTNNRRKPREQERDVHQLGRHYGLLCRDERHKRSRTLEI